MSERLISLNSDLKRLRDEGYEVSIEHAHLRMDHIPYVTTERQLAYGTLVSTLNFNGDLTAVPETHVVTFIGSTPCDRDGVPLSKIVNDSTPQTLAPGLEIQHSFSSKPAGGYSDYYDKMTAYADMLGGPAQALDPGATAQTFLVREMGEDESVFVYLDSASSRAGIGAVTAKLEAVRKVGIVGLGGTGSYVLDLMAKTPVSEIHLYDGDNLLTHNAFRAPGAAAIDELRLQPNKAEHFRDQYARMRRGIHAHTGYVDTTNLDQLRDMDFVFLCLDDGAAKRPLVEKLEEWGTSFIDAGMGVAEVDGKLSGLVRVTTSTPARREHVWGRDRIPFGADDPDNDYDHNIQIADLNALNATLAVIKFKKLYGFYLDLENEHFAIYEIDGNSMINEDQP